MAELLASSLVSMSRARMGGRDHEFPLVVQQQALHRQKQVCACCGESIRYLGEAGRSGHQYGEIGHAHHVVPIKFGGTAALSNCVIICQACHYSAHEGGNYRWGTVIGRPQDFPYMNGLTN